MKVKGKVVNYYGWVVQLTKAGNYKVSVFLGVVLVPFMDVGG